jgi:gliding motility-associated-like protein
MQEPLSPGKRSKIKHFKLNPWTKLAAAAAVFLGAFLSLFIFIPDGVAQEKSGVMTEQEGDLHSRKEKETGMATPLGGGSCKIVGPYMKNFSFRSYSSCPSEQGEISKSLGWENLLQNPSDPDLAFSQVDFFNTCAGGENPGDSDVGVPYNFAGHQKALFMHEYAGLIAYSKEDNKRDYRSFIQGEIDGELEAGKMYVFELWLSPGEASRYAVSGMGAYISDVKLKYEDYATPTGYQELFNIQPQIYAKSVIKNNEVWHSIRGSFIASGGEKFVTIGNFFRDHEIEVEEVNPEADRDFAYYYLDGIKFYQIEEGAVDVGPDLYICKGSSVQLNDVFYSGSLINPTWYPNIWINDRYDINAVVSPEETTTYRLMFRAGVPGESDYCSVYDELTVFVEDCNSCELSLDENQIFIQPVSCSLQNGLVTGITFSGASGELTYEWKDAEGTILTTETGADLVNVEAGVYTLIATDMMGCSVTKTFTVEEEQTPFQLEVQEMQNPSCYGYADGRAAVSLSGGEAPFSYAWYDEDENRLGIAPTIDELAAGNYKVMVTDSRGCIAEGNFTVSEPAPIEVNGGEDEHICAGDSVNLQAAVETSGEGFVYLWEPSTGLSEVNIANPIAFPEVSTVYTVTVQKDNCTSTDQVEVVVEECPVECTLAVDESSVEVSPSCEGGGGAIRGLGISGAYGNMIFSWKDAGGNKVGTEADLQNVPAGNYFLSISDEEGCEMTFSQIIPAIEKQALQINFGRDNILCQGNSLYLNASIPVAQSYLWQDGSTSAGYQVQEIGWYKVEVATPCGTVSDSVEVIFRDCGLPVEIANALTPNGDGTNQVFYIRNIDLYSDNELFIYNRWGNIVYHAKGYNNTWEGTYKGEALPVATYYYVLYLDSKSREQVYKGSVSIVK